MSDQPYKESVLTGKALDRIFGALWPFVDSDKRVAFTAKMLNVTVGTVYHWRNGRRRPPGLLRSWLQMYALLTPEQRQVFRMWRTGHE